MFKNKKVFSSFSTDNIEKAKQFYQDTLGFTVKDNTMGVIELHIGDSPPIVIYPKPNHEPATFTILNFPVEDIKKAVDQLTEKGVVFEQYNEPIETDKNGICWSDGEGPNIAWFKDPAGNILSVLEE